MKNFEDLIAERMNNPEYDKQIAKHVFREKTRKSSVLVPFAAAALLILSLGLSMQLVLQHREDQIYDALSDSMSGGFMLVDISEFDED